MARYRKKKPIFSRCRLCGRFNTELESRLRIFNAEKCGCGRTLDLMKECWGCKKILSFTRYGTDNATPSRRVSRCYDCFIPKKYKYRPRLYRGKQPKHQEDAQLKVRRAVSSGKIKKPNKCQRCLKTFEKRKLGGHHYAGYDQPLKVIFVCHKCHAFLHLKRSA